MNAPRLNSKVNAAIVAHVGIPMSKQFPTTNTKRVSPSPSQHSWLGHSCFTVNDPGRRTQDAGRRAQVTSPTYRGPQGAGRRPARPSCLYIRPQDAGHRAPNPEARALYPRQIKIHRWSRVRGARKSLRLCIEYEPNATLSGTLIPKPCCF
jgi:hypothetical protein